MPVIEDTEYLEVNGVALSTPAWRATDLSMLRGPALRGDDVLIPYRAGRKPKRRWVDARRIAIPIDIFGDVDQDGVEYAEADVRSGLGLQTNLDYLEANLGFAVASDTGTVSATWHRPDGSTRTADVHPISLDLTAGGSFVAVGAVLDLNIPAGRFV